jgi:serine/threonine protein kinase
MAIPLSSIDDWLTKEIGNHSHPSNAQKKQEMLGDLYTAVNGFDGIGLSVEDILGSGGMGFVLKGVIRNVDKLKNSWNSSNSKEDLGEQVLLVDPSSGNKLRPADLLSKITVLGNYFVDEKHKLIVSNPYNGKKYKSIREAELFFKDERKCSKQDLEKMIGQIESRDYPRPGQVVAIKVSKNPADTKFGREKKMTYITILKKDQDAADNIVSYYDSGCLESSNKAFRYHVMEYLMNLVSITDFTGLEQKIDIYRKILKAVKFVHDYGIVHRDLKPSNILISAKPTSDYYEFKKKSFELQKTRATIWPLQARKVLVPSQLIEKESILSSDVKHYSELIKPSVVKLADFGLAKFTNHSFGDTFSQNTVQGAIMGSPFYMAPEQGGGSSQEHSDKRIDTFQLGNILYEIVTGRPPYEDRQAELNIINSDNSFNFTYYLMALRSNCPTHPAKLNKDIDSTMVKILARALNKDINRRYQSVDEMIHDVDKWTEHNAQQKSTGSTARFIKSVLFRKDVVSGPDYSDKVFV